MIRGMLVCMSLALMLFGIALALTKLWDGRPLIALLTVLVYLIMAALIMPQGD